MATGGEGTTGLRLKFPARLAITNLDRMGISSRKTPVICSQNIGTLAGCTHRHAAGGVFWVKRKMHIRLLGILSKYVYDVAVFFNTVMMNFKTS